MRVALLLVLVSLVPVLGGCLGGDDGEGARLAKPTDSAVLVPVPPTPTRQQALFDPNDPGYTITTRWHVGDGWDWESNATPAQYRTARVVEEKEVGGRTHYRVEETYGRVGARASGRVTHWVDGGTWGVLNATDETGSMFHYEPAKPLRFYRNATFWYNETGVDRLTGQVLHSSWYFYSFLEGPWEVVRVREIGNLAAFKVVHEGYDGSRRASLTYWVSPEWTQPLRYRVGDVQWSLVSAEEGGRRFGALQPT